MQGNSNPAGTNAVPQRMGYEKGHTSVRIMGVFILLVELGLLFAYGFSGYLINEVGSWGGSTAYNTLIPAEWTFGG